MTWIPPKCPLLAVDVVVLYPDGKIVAIQRKFPPLGLALPGGFVDEGESCEHAAIREIKEELNIDIACLELIGVWSDPKRDPRRHVVSVSYKAYPANWKIQPTAGDDAKSIVMVDYLEYQKLEWCFDHKQIIQTAKPGNYKKYD